MKSRKKSKVQKTVKEAEETVAANPRYGGLTIAEATRRILQGKKVESSTDSPDRSFT